MNSMPAWLVLTLRLLLTVIIPVLLVLTNVRVLMTHAFPDFEYNLPGFPPDPYGFTKEDRLKWSKISIDYLLNNESIKFLRDLRFPNGVLAPEPSRSDYLDGDYNRFYNDRELKHMLDVKNVTRGALNVWAGGGILVLLCVAALFYFGEKTALRAGSLGGATLTIVILLGIVTYVLVGFNTFFVQFHQVFFESGSWTFLWSDSLIRLFPTRFWQDTFLFVGGATIVEAAVVAAVAWWGVR